MADKITLDATKLLKSYGGETSGQLNVKVGIIQKRQPKTS